MSWMQGMGHTPWNLPLTIPSSPTRPGCAGYGCMGEVGTGSRLIFVSLTVIVHLREQCVFSLCPGLDVPEQETALTRQLPSVL